MPRFAEMPEVHRYVAVALERTGVTTAFPIQAAIVPLGASGRDLLVQSPTGSGKTLAYGLPIVHRLGQGGDAPTAIVLVPTRELAVQVTNDLVPIAWARQIRCMAVHGGVPITRQARRAAVTPLIVATPGRLVDLMGQGAIDLSKVTTLVLDEADRMLDMGFQPQVDEIVRALPTKRQTMLFSATLDGKVAKVAAAYTTKPETIRNEDAPGEAGEIEHRFVSTALASKVDTLLGELDSQGRDLTVIFVRTQQGAENLKESLRTYGLRATAIHGGMGQHERRREHRRFQDGTCNVLVATDVFARGMDEDRITHVVNFELPEDGDAYRHRTGRTGRAGRSGHAVTLVAPTQRHAADRMLYEAGMPNGLLKGIASPKEHGFQVVPESQRYVDPPEAEQHRPAGRRSGADGAVEKTAGNFRTRRNPSFDAGGAGGPQRSQAGTGPRRSGWAERAGATGTPGRGVVTGYDDTKGFGFIKQASGGKDVFFHRSTLAGASPARLAPGLEVSFALETSDGKKLRAKTVRVAD